MSTVLLTHDAYEGKRVPDLKQELKQRGLSTSGKRSDLIQRLIDNDSRSAKVLPTEAQKASVGKVRSVSTTHKRSASATQVSKAVNKDNSVAPPPTAGSVGTSEGASIPPPPDMEPGQVSTSSVTQPSPLEPGPNAPGVPPEKTAAAPITFEVQIPYETVEPEQGPEIVSPLLQYTHTISHASVASHDVLLLPRAPNLYRIQPGGWPGSTCSQSSHGIRRGNVPWRWSGPPPAHL